MLPLPEDYADLLRALVEAEAEFVLVGGWAVAVHGYGRATDDLDVLVRPSQDNALRVYQALDGFGAPLAFHGVTEDLFATPGYGYRVGRKPLLIEVLTKISGVTFDEAAANAVTVDVAGVPVRVIGRDALLVNKTAAGRAKDLADIEALSTKESPE